ncbi:MAG: DNA mismatch repair protein MutS [Clostridia bacterium]|jgi:DNA mismatch repair protein MutS|nr:DNA mismatch repair protein MutS [Clostridia bacterium]
MLGNTPMMQQYQQIKRQYPDTLLFFRLGDFYEMFGPDATLAAKELEITLTGREAGLEERIPMCGVPYHAVDTYLARLIQKGYKVAICEQTEDPRTAKGIVKREVIRVVTPGTSLDGQLFTEEGNNYLAAVCLEEGTWGLAFTDFSTGEFRVTDFIGANAQAALRDELSRINPAEILIRAASAETVRPLAKGAVLTSLEEDIFSYRQARTLLAGHFQADSPESRLPAEAKAAVCSAGAILYYLQETQKAPPQQIRQLKMYQAESFLMIDAVTFRNLEITRTLRANEKKGSLLEIMDKTRTAAGSRLLKTWLQRPLTDRSALEERHQAVEVLLQHWSLRQGLRKSLDEVYDMERLTTRILYKRALPRELLALRNSLSVLPEIKSILSNLLNSVYLSGLTSELDTLEDIRALLERAVCDEAPPNLNSGNIIKAGFHEEVDRLRTAGQNGKKWIAALEASEKEKTGIKSLKVGFNKVFGYYFEVTRANLALVPEYFQRKQTLANGERYVTEELLRLENEVLGAEEKLLALEAEIYDSLLTEVGSFRDRIQKTTQVLSQLDVLQSLAELAAKNNYVRPQLLEKEKNILEFKGLRHPVVERLLDSHSFIPNDLEIATEVILSIITGPNMGGKSTFCRSVALAVIMAQAGSFVPAEQAVISLRDRVFARVGASDDLGSGQSTFMVEMNEVANILRQATPHSLVILDEVGRGTSTYDGLSMAWAVSEYLVLRQKAKTLFATHYHELTQLEENIPGIRNLSAAVREKGEQIIFLHKIIDGPADKSYGIQVGRLAGLPAEVIERAHAVLRDIEAEHLGRTIVPTGQPAAAAETAPAQTSFLTEQEEEVLGRLSALDLNSITPLEALNILAGLKKMIK